MTVEIVDLTARPDVAATCAAWEFGMWGCQSGGSLDRSLEAFDKAARGDPEVLTLVALRDGKPAGTVSLRPSDFGGRPDLTPWMASVYVHPEHRRAGLAHALITRLMAAAFERGHRRLHLITEHAETLYASLGWTTFDHVVGLHGPAVLMRRDRD